jgi:hypothetical protein
MGSTTGFITVRILASSLQRLYEWDYALVSVHRTDWIWCGPRRRVPPCLFPFDRSILDSAVLQWLMMILWALCSEWSTIEHLAWEHKIVTALDTRQALSSESQKLSPTLETDRRASPVALIGSVPDLFRGIHTVYVYAALQPNLNDTFCTPCIRI